MDSYIVVAQMKVGKPDACEWTITDGRNACDAAHTYAARFIERGFLHVMVRQCGPIIANLSGRRQP